MRGTLLSLDATFQRHGHPLSEQIAAPAGVDLGIGGDSVTASRPRHPHPHDRLEVDHRGGTAEDQVRRSPRKLPRPHIGELRSQAIEFLRQRAIA